jgi:2-polyprenyl-6-methoxyphenol hydroxylase-like FAD-dependent oxidoreductase
MSAATKAGDARQAAVIGAGIGGLAAAIALRQAGWEATVYEAAPEIQPLGAGLSIWPNGVRALRGLGLADLAAAAPRADGALRRADGSVLAEFDPDAIEARFGAPLVGFHRADLHEGLIAGLGSEWVRTGMRLERIEDEELFFGDGSSARPDLIVGADGLNSTVRQALLGDGGPRDSGLVAFRGVADLDAAVPAGEWWGSGSVAGLLQLADGRVYWYFAYRGEPDRAALPALLSEYGDAVQEAARRTDKEQVLVHRLYDRDPVPSWSRGRVTLLGDAAHPMLPFLGQGACSALEDAAALAAAMTEEAGVEAGLAAYERARTKPTAALVAGSRKAAKAALLRNGAARRFRNALVSRAPESARLRQLDSFLA